MGGVKKIMSLFKTKINKPARIKSTFISNYVDIKYESSGNENKMLSIKEYLEEIRLYLKDNIINNLQELDIWK